MTIRRGKRTADIASGKANGRAPAAGEEPIRPNALMQQVAQALRARGVAVKAAALAMGVSTNTLQNHLRGEHVRSDSARKYEAWLAGRAINQKVFVFPQRNASPDVEVPKVTDDDLPPPPPSPNLIVDIFSGCGGLSLGFDLLGNGTQFKTILALDNQSGPIEVLNSNLAALNRCESPVGQRVDLTEFMNEAEFLTFYIRHAATHCRDSATYSRLSNLLGGSFSDFIRYVAAIDLAYFEELHAIRLSARWRKACEALDNSVLNQTSVVGFHDKLRLPRPGTRVPTMPVVLWGGEQPVRNITPPEASASAMAEAEVELNGEVAALTAKREASGPGQLNASARRVRAFSNFIDSTAFAPVKSAWIRWRARRVTLRTALFADERFAKEVRELYVDTYPVSVLVGGPPCQGFSRIGRGKIRSLREAMVHVHGDTEAGDARNLLFRQYVMVLGALRPPVFLFENVQHFQSTVKTGGSEFQATEVLAEAIANMSDGEISYAVASRVIDASRHGVPQARQRFFMCGVLREQTYSGKNEESPETSAANCLALPQFADVPMSAALAGLPEPNFVGGDAGSTDAMNNRVRLEGSLAGNGVTGRFAAWVRQPAPGTNSEPDEADSHAARVARSDDAAFFALMGPGKRWMDYRADDSSTVADIRNILSSLASLPASVFANVQQAASKSGHLIPSLIEIRDLMNKADGSLAIRLLLEQVGEKLGAPHHLLTDNYLAKRDGHHGDWVARLDGSRPAKTMVSHMGKDTYGYIHPAMPRTISIREAARVQSFPDWFSFAPVSLTDAFKMIGNAVPPLLSCTIAGRVAWHLATKRNAVSSNETKFTRVRARQALAQ